MNTCWNRVVWWIRRNEIRHRNRAMVERNYMPMLYAGTIKLGWFCAGGCGTYAYRGSIPTSADKMASEKCRAFTLEMCSHVLCLMCGLFICCIVSHNHYRAQHQHHHRIVSLFYDVAHTLFAACCHTKTLLLQVDWKQFCTVKPILKK
jgi:hypothetical protein